MRKSFALASLLLVVSAFGAARAAAQDLVITNARIVVGNGTVIDQGSIVVRGGRIASVSAGRPRAQADSRRRRRSTRVA